MKAVEKLCHPHLLSGRTAMVCKPAKCLLYLIRHVTQKGDPSEDFSGQPIDKGGFGLKIRRTHSLEIQADHQIVVFQIIGKSPQGGSLSILPRPVNGKIVAGVDHLADFLQSGMERYHIVPGRGAGAGYIEGFCHWFQSPLIHDVIIKGYHMTQFISRRKVAFPQDLYYTSYNSHKYVLEQGGDT